MRTRRFIFGLLLFLSCSAARAEYALVDKIVYWLNDEYTSASVQNFLTDGGAVTVPSYVTYRGVKYKVVAMDKNDFNTSTRNTYNVSSLVFGEGLITDLATLDAASRERLERGFRYDYAPSRAAITSLNLPNTLLRIGRGAFDGMKSLKSITIPESVKYLPDDDKNVFESYLPNLQSVTVLGLPSYEYSTSLFSTEELNCMSQDEEGNYDYVEHIQKKFNLKYCQNLKKFDMPMFQNVLPILKAAQSANDKLAIQTEKCNAALLKLSSNKDIKIATPELKPEAYLSNQSVETAYNQASQYILSLYAYYKKYITLHDSLQNQLAQHAYYDGSILEYELPQFTYSDPEISTMSSQMTTIISKMVTKYNDLVGGDMERNMFVNNLPKFIEKYTALHPDKKAAIDGIYLDYRCEDKPQQDVYVRQYIENGNRPTEKSCREKQWTLYQSYFSSREQFDERYNKSLSDKTFNSEINARRKAYTDLQTMKRQVQANIKNIKLSNMYKKPNDQTSTIINFLNDLKKSKYYYSDAVAYLIETIPAIQKEYEKNGQYFSSQLAFFEAYTSDSYSQVLKDNKKK